MKKLPGLRALREERGLTIEDIFLKTRINVDLLNAIENGEFQLLPAPASTKKFIQMYAEAIGIDAGIILAPLSAPCGRNTGRAGKVAVVKAQIAFDRKPLSRYLRYAVPAVAIMPPPVCYAFFYEKGPLGIFQRNVTVVEQEGSCFPSLPPP